MPQTTTTTEMTVEQTSLIEDLTDIFYNPSGVLARRAAGNLLGVGLILMVLYSILSIASLSALEPLWEAEFARGMATALEENPEIATQLEGARAFTSLMTIVGGVLFIPLIALIVGGLIRLLSIPFDAKLTFKVSAMIAIYAQFPRLLQQILNVVQGYILSPDALTSRFAIGFSPARFLDVETTAPILMVLAERFDLFTIWATVIIGIGFKVLGKLPTRSAIAAASLVWLIVALPAIVGAL